MDKILVLKLLSRLFCVVSVILLALFFYLGFTGNQPGTDWRGSMLFYAVSLLFFGLLGDIVSDMAQELRRD
jgi:hypothetical protein